jgi:hypothetical protein
MRNRFRAAMAAYGALAAMAAFTLDGKLRIIVLIFLGGMVLKTLAAYKSGRAER